MILTQTNINNPEVVGRLGNQMFVIASIFGLSRSLNVGYTFPEWSYNHHLTLPIRSSSDIKTDDSVDEGSHGYDKDLVLQLRLKNYNDIVNVNGYLQSYLYFHNDGDEVVKMFKGTAKTDPVHTNICSMHVRRGDYIGLSDYHPCCTIDYYRKAMEHIRRVSGRDMSFMVYSDDIDWCMDKFKLEYDVSFKTDSVSDFDDLIDMSRCEHNIIANSSFSWWGAYLNNNPRKTVIAPKQWFGKKLKDYDTSGYYLDGWITI